MGPRGDWEVVPIHRHLINVSFLWYVLIHEDLDGTIVFGPSDFNLQWAKEESGLHAMTEGVSGKPEVFLRLVGHPVK